MAKSQHPIDDMTPGQMRAVLHHIAKVAPRADESCEVPGITLVEAAARSLAERGNAAFYDNKNEPETPNVPRDIPDGRARGQSAEISGPNHKREPES